MSNSWNDPRPPMNWGRTNKLAIVSLVAGIVGVLLSWCTFGIPSIVAIVTGHMALSQIKRTGEEGRGLAIAGLLMGYLSLLVAIALTVFTILAGTWSFDWNVGDDGMMNDDDMMDND